MTEEEVVAIPREVMRNFVICKGYWIAYISCGLTRTTPNLERPHGDQFIVLLHYNRLGRTAVQAHHQLKKVHVSEVGWFKKFDSVNYRLKDIQRSGSSVVHTRASILRAVQANSKNCVQKWSAKIGASRETVCRALHANDKSPKRPRVVPRDLTRAQLKKRADTCTLLLDRAADTQRTRFITPKMKSGSRTMILTTLSNDMMSIKILSLLRSGQPMAVLVLLLRRTSVLRDPWRRWDCRLHFLMQGSRGDGVQSSCQSHNGGQNLVLDEQHETTLCENHPVKAEVPRDGVDTPSTVFPEHLSMQFPRISKSGKFLSWMELQEPQGRGVRTANLDRDQASRLLEERTRTTAGTIENDRENTGKVDRDCRNCCHEVKTLKKYYYLCVTQYLAFNKLKTVTKC